MRPGEMHTKKIAQGNAKCSRELLANSVEATKKPRRDWINPQQLWITWMMN